MQGHLIPKLVSPGHLNKLRAADRQHSGQVQPLLSASSLVGRAAIKRSTIISDLVWSWKLLRGSLFSNCTVFGSQMSKAQLCSFTAAVCGFAAVPSLEKCYCLWSGVLIPERVALQPLTEPQWHESERKMVQTPSNSINLKSKFLAISTVPVLVYCLQVSVSFGNFSWAQEARISGIELFIPLNLFKISPCSARF